MSAAAAEKRKWTAEEYLAMERDSPEKHEFFDGEIFAMAGASYTHNVIVSNLIVALGKVLQDQCFVLTSDMKIFIPAKNGYVYPDASILCGKPDFPDDKQDVITNPDVIFEVLSKSTEKFDRGDKFGYYRSVPSLSDYVLVSQSKVLVEHFTRQPDGTWNMRELGAGQSLRLPCGEFPVSHLYLRVLPPG